MPEETKPAASSPAPKAAEKPADTETDLEESDEEGDEDSLPFHKHPRWKKVHGELKEYKSLDMTPAELQENLKRLKQYDEIVEAENKKIAARKKANLDDEEEPDEETKKRRKMARKELSKIAPEVDRIEKAATQVDIFFNSLERTATREMTKLLKDAGMSTKEKSLEAMADVLSGTISEDEELYDEYLRNPKGAIQEAFKRFRADSVEAATRAAKANLQKDKTKLLGLPKAHKSGGSSEVAVNRAEGPRNLKEAKIAAERRLAALEE